MISAYHTAARNRNSLFSLKLFILSIVFGMIDKKVRKPRQHRKEQTTYGF